MKIKNMAAVLVFLLVPLASHALTMGYTPSMDSNTTLFFFNTLYSSKMLYNVSGYSSLQGVNPKNPAASPLTKPSCLPVQTLTPVITDVETGTEPLCPFTPPQTPQAPPVPEPATMLLVGSALTGMGLFRKFF